MITYKDSKLILALGGEKKMNVHCSDRQKKKTAVWKCGCVLYRLQQIDLSRFEKGNIIVKNLRQKRILSDGTVKIYNYHYENIDVFGKGQIHLPVKGKKRHNPNDSNWKIRDGIVYRNEIEQRINNATIRLDRAIKELNSYKKSTEKLETMTTVMDSVKRAMANRKEYEKIKKIEAEKHGSFSCGSIYEINGLIVTDLGEEVRSKNECLFANKLREMNIPYLYEMSIGGGVLPDFTLFVEDKVYFVELFGKLNDEEYREKQKEKIKKYEEMDIFTGGQLVLIDVTMGFSMPIIEGLLREIIENGAPEKMIAGYSRHKYDQIEARKRACFD
ncbi:MAG: hypothetical protein IKJ59_10270 [Clostridia bacterium]|nr:hypothetical protein [Clostridia bacterium]